MTARCAGSANTNTTRTMTFTMKWKEKKVPTNNGEALPIEDGKEAAKICREHNEMYPRYTHWVERIEPQTKQEEV